jgi:hypothetical protein
MGNRTFRTVVSDEHRVVPESHDRTSADDASHGALDGLACLLAHDTEDLAKGRPQVSPRLQPVRISAVGLSICTRPSASVAIAASPTLISVTRYRSWV